MKKFFENDNLLIAILILVFVTFLILPFYLESSEVTPLDTSKDGAVIFWLPENAAVDYVKRQTKEDDVYIVSNGDEYSIITIGEVRLEVPRNGKFFDKYELYSAAKRYKKTHTSDVIHDEESEVMFPK